MQTKVNWFEIATRDLERASRFYETLFATSLRRENMDGTQMAIFTHGSESQGCLIGGDWIEPSPQGTLVYLDAGPSIDAVISRVTPVGGKIAMDKTQLPRELGYICHVIDTEGNRIALHAMN